MVHAPFGTMPADTLTAYILFSGTFNQTGIDMTPDDYGGEMDPQIQVLPHHCPQRQHMRCCFQA